MPTVVEIAPETPNELVIARRIAAPPAALYRCWTDPELIPRWFCPRPWRAEVVKMDVRPGGGSLMTFHGPEGESFPNNGVYLEVVPDRKLVFTDAFTEGWVPNPGMMFTGIVTFEDAGNGETLYVARARHWTEDAAKRHTDMGFHEGWGIVAGQLEEVAREL